MQRRHRLTITCSILLLALASGVPVLAGPLVFDDTVRIGTPIPLEAAATYAPASPTRGTASAVVTQLRQVTGSLHVSVAGFPPLTVVGGPVNANVAFDTPGSLPRTFTLPALFTGTVTAGGNPSISATGIRLQATGMPLMAVYDLSQQRVVANGGIGGILRLCILGDQGPCENAYFTRPFPMTPIGVPGSVGTIPISGGYVDSVAGLGWTTGVIATATTSTSAVVSGSRASNSISLVTAFLLKRTDLSQAHAGIARLNLNFQPLGTTTTTSLGGTTTTTTLPPIDLDVGIAATKLVVVDKLDAAGKAKTVFVAKTPDAAKGPGTDPDTIGGVLDLSYTGAAGQFVVPEGALSGDTGWTANKETGAKFVNKAAPGGPTGAKVVVIKPNNLLKLVGKSLGDTPLDITMAGAPDASGVDVVYTVTNGGSTVRHCANFAQSACAYTTIAGNTGSKLVCKNGTPGACPP